MKTIDYISEITSIDSKYVILIIKTFVIFFTIYILKKIGIRILKKIKDTKKEWINSFNNYFINFSNRIKWIYYL